MKRTIRYKAVYGPNKETVEVRSIPGTVDGNIFIPDNTKGELHEHLLWSAANPQEALEQAIQELKLQEAYRKKELHLVRLAKGSAISQLKSIQSL